MRVVTAPSGQNENCKGRAGIMLPLTLLTCFTYKYKDWKKSIDIIIVIQNLTGLNSHCDSDSHFSSYSDSDFQIDSESHCVSDS